MGSQGEQKELRAVSPKLFRYISETLEVSNIHPYDIQATAVEKEDGLQVFIQYGNNFNHSKSDYFTHQAIEKRNEEIDAFIKVIAEACKQTMIADYFKMMKM